MRIEVDNVTNATPGLQLYPVFNTRAGCWTQPAKTDGLREEVCRRQWIDAG